MGLDLDLQVGGPPLRLLEGKDAPGILGIVDQGDTRETGAHLLEQL